MPLSPIGIQLFRTNAVPESSAERDIIANNNYYTSTTINPDE